MGENYPRRRSPPTKRTSSGGVVEVCGKYRQPGHIMADCRRIEVCRRCERPGYRAARCPVSSSELAAIQAQEEELRRSKGKKKQGTRASVSGEASANKEDTNHHRTTPTEAKGSNNINHTIDDSMVEEIRRLRSYTIATVIKGFAGLVPYKRVKVEVAALVAPELEWESRPFYDDRILITCPTVALARKLENLGEIALQDFTIRCEPCKAATKATGIAEGELRWIIAKGLPIFCQRADMVARVLKPVGDLVYLAKESAYFVGYYKAAVRVPRGKKLPTLINYSVLTDKFSVQVALERGEPPFPWDLPLEKTVAPGGTPGGAGIVDERNNLLKGKTPVGQLGKDREETDGTSGVEGYGRMPANATSEHGIQRKSGGFGDSAYQHQQEIKGGK
ncbi:hypothetical protein J5N97_009209 [Dioscorea zingiberensis]|uniref:CCHC-type domain-containing protein n=1 Tax=Dioscorea zingiberensis TaxID=325984 RepID=A0A9D5CXV2_9LILI|nr:hypothetical protein J5N97_009209 [Dioscorea zingiberensis]